MSYDHLQHATTYGPNHPDYDPVANDEIERHEKTFGRYNDAPPGWREISEKEFVQGQFFLNPLTKHEFRQILHAGVNSEKGHALVNARLYFFHDGTGVALMNDCWAGKLRYFAFGCDHTYREVYGEEARKLGLRPLGQCDHAYLCDKCDHTMLVDSSD
jgi:hypothetical protein